MLLPIPAYGVIVIVSGGSISISVGIGIVDKSEQVGQCLYRLSSVKIKYQLSSGSVKVEFRLTSG